MEGNTLRDVVETRRVLARESSVDEDVRVGVEVLAALLDVAEAANEVVSPDYRTAPGPYAQGVRLDAMRDLMGALDRLAEHDV